jgi:NAD(P)-dependent dehydrogenase (short-subunit alcohol dehydrogenase family)
MSNTDGRACGVRLRQAGFSAQQAAYAKLFADRYAADNIRMNNVLPGFIDSFPEQPEVRERVPMKRYGRAGRTRRRAVRGGPALCMFARNSLS